MVYLSPHSINKFANDKNSSEGNVDLDWTKEKEKKHETTIPVFRYVENHSFTKHLIKLLFIALQYFPQKQ